MPTIEISKTIIIITLYIFLFIEILSSKIENPSHNPPSAGIIYLEMNMGLIKIDNIIPTNIVKNTIEISNVEYVISFLFFKLM